MISDTLISRNIFHHNYTYHLIFKDQHLIFSASCAPEMQLFRTSYPIIENEFGHTDVKRFDRDETVMKSRVPNINAINRIASTRNR